jgi:hypothetical protein
MAAAATGSQWQAGARPRRGDKFAAAGKFFDREVDDSESDGAELSCHCGDVSCFKMATCRCADVRA